MTGIVSSGNSSRHGTHQVAQNVRITTFPDRSAVDMRSPSKVTSVAAGAADPTCSSFACVADPRRLFQIIAVAAQLKWSG